MEQIKWNIDSILEENIKRTTLLNANYNPITGEGLDTILEEERVKLEIPDFAIPVQYVPKEFAQTKLVQEILRAGSIQNFIDTHPWQAGVPTELDIERQLRRLRHKHDFTFWAYFCIQITLKKGGKGRFKLNYPQLLTLKLCEKLRKAGEPIDIIILKARQWGGSTFCIFYQTWIAFKWDEYHNFVVAAHVQSAAENILSMLKEAISYYPVWDLGLEDGTTINLAPRGRTGNANVIKDSAHNQVLATIFYIGSAERPDTLRSSNTHGAHYSEVGIWPDTPEKRPESLVASISGGMTTAPLDMQVMESTAKSSDDYFHDVWTSAKKGDSSYHPLFIPWYYIPHDTIAIKDKEEFAKWLYDHRNEENTNGKWKDSGKHYWWLWELGATLEGINWYRNKRRSFTDYKEMANEAPSNDIEAFQTAGQKVFDIYDVQRFETLTKAPLVCGDLLADGIEGESAITNIRFQERRDGNVRIWEYPDYSPVEDRYLVAVDIGGPNKTSDYSSVRVFDRLTMMTEIGGLNGVPAIVAEMHYHTDHDFLAYDAMRIAKWYNNALLVIESNTVEFERDADTGGEGSEYILDIVSKIYPNLYMRQRKSEEIKEGTVGQWGFRTDRFTKPAIINHMKTCLRYSKWKEPSKTCCEEMALYIQEKNKFTAPPKKHDDVLMATAIGLWVCYNEMNLPTWTKNSKERHKKKFKGTNADIVKL